MNATYLCPWHKMTAWFSPLSRMLATSNVPNGIVELLVPSVDLFVELRERFGSSLDYIVLGVSASQREQELQDQLQMLRKELKEIQRRILVMLEMLGEPA